MWLRLAMASWFTRTLVLILVVGVIGLPLLFAVDLSSGGWTTATSDWRRLGPWMSVGVFSVLVGSLLGMLMEFEKEKYEEALRGVGVADFKKVARAVERGPVPEDPVVRRAAARLAELYIQQSKPLWESLFFYPIAIGCQVCLALQAVDDDSFRPWGVVPPLAMAMALGAAAMRVWLRLPLLEARLQLLTMHESEIPA